MAIEFRTGFLGFNRDDVLDYVHKKDSEIKAMSTELNDMLKKVRDELDTVKSELADVKNQNTRLETENQTMRNELNAYESKAEEMERLSSRIGKLYLVSQSSAKSIVDKAEENAQIIQQQTDAGLANIADTQAELSAITGRIVAASKTFVTELDALNHSLENAKRKVTENQDSSLKISEEFAEIYNKLS